ncbi:hypothetical protein FXO38_19092 [Capsicum annuum]|nr:hypothetical protein FXO38_19092 [Capsicum annuum]
MDKIRINYCGMPIYFSLQEFSIVTGLRCDCLEEPPIAKGTYHKRFKASSKTKKCKEKIDGLLDIARCGYKASNLLIDLRDKTIPKQYREKLCLVWFAHLVILAGDINKVIEVDLLARAEDFNKFKIIPGDTTTTT